LKQALENKEQRITELKTVLANPLRSEVPEIQSLMQDLSVKKREYDELESVLTETQANLAKYQKKLAGVAEKNEQLQARNTQLKKTLGTIQRKQGESAAALESGHRERDELRLKIEGILQENESLHAQLRAASASHDQGKTAWTSKCQELDQSRSAIASLEGVMEAQRKEIARWNSERQRLAELLERQGQITAHFETLADTESNRAKELEAKAKRLQRENRALQEGVTRVENGSALIAQVNEQLLPRLNDSLRSKLVRITQDHLTPTSERLKKTIDTLASLLNQVANSGDAHGLRKEQNAEGKAAVDSLLTVISALFHAFQNQFRDEKSIPGLENSDNAFLEFLASKCVQLDSILKENDFMTPQFISMDFLFSGSIEDRRQILNQIRSAGWDIPATFDLFCAQILVNIAQRHEIDQLKQLFHDQALRIEQIQQALECEDFSSAQVVSEQIGEKIRSLRNRRRKLQAKLKARENYDGAHPSIAEYEKTLKSIEAKNSKLEADLKSLVNDATALQRELDAKSQQLVSLEKSHNSLIEESAEHQRKHLEEICDLEKVLDERNREIRDLTLNFNQLTSDSEQQIESLRKASKEIKERLVSRTAKYKRHVSLLEQRKKNLEQQLVARLRAQERQSQEDLDRATAAQNELRAQFDEQFRATKDQVQKNRELSDRLSTSLAETEKRNQQLTSEISRLTVAKKSLEVQLRAVEDRMKRETQILTSQAAMKAMNAETRFQEDINALKSRYAKEKSELIVSVLAEFDQLEQFEDEEITDAAFLTVMEQVARGNLGNGRYSVARAHV
jgi:chromosome segregation ATPase